ncbi:RodZ domain-containing protein [Pantanalinema sp. GBBB05]|uniref:helix-turn-helix domain-containing protein n=1 Tax=Pantanalinema sp. GBBB05 TaxID=2604139 RepID=UPI001D443388|nr:DUF4115 domain-containing protein [Pantanalinema sp. GBBB05]
MKELDSVQVAQLKRIAEQLVETRQQKSITLDAVATATYIPQRLLQALEAEQFERLPEPVYVQGFIRRYADYLGLDGKALSQTFDLHPIAPLPSVAEHLGSGVVAPPVAAPARSDMSPRTVKTPSVNGAFAERASESGTPPEPSSPKVVEPAISPPEVTRGDATVVPDPTASRSEPTVPKSPAAPPRTEVSQPIQPLPASTTTTVTPLTPAINAAPISTPAKRPVLPLALVGGAIALVAIGAVAILNQPKSTDRSTVSNPAVSDPATKAAPSSDVSSATSPTASPVPAAPGVSSAPVQVAVNLTDRAWLEVVVDGKVEVEDVKEKGFQKTWTAERELFIRSGNAGAVLVSFNQATAKPMGKVGQVEEATYTPDSAAQPQTESTSQSVAEPTAEQLQSSSPN